MPLKQFVNGKLWVICDTVILRKFKEQEIRGKVVAWLPAGPDGVALWHVAHTDGDEEDLDEVEVQELWHPGTG